MKTMTFKQRIQAFWAGEQPDLIPYSIYWNEWRHTADDPAWPALFAKGLGLTRHIEILKFDQSEINVSTKTSEQAGRTTQQVCLRSPLGEVRERYVDGWRREFFLKTADDYRIMIDIVKRTKVKPAYEAFLREEARLGNKAAALACIGRSPLQTLLVDWAGVENLAMQLYELSDAVEELYTALGERFRQSVELAALGPGRFVSVLENFTAEALGPERFQQYLLPVYENYFPQLKASGKIVGLHFDGRLAACRKVIATAPFDVVESLTPPPEGDLTLAEARQAWPEKLFWSNLNLGLYELPASELAETVLARVEEAAVDGRFLAFEISEQYPANWRTSIPVVLDALEATRAG